MIVGFFSLVVGLVLGFVLGGKWERGRPLRNFIKALDGVEIVSGYRFPYTPREHHHVHFSSRHDTPPGYSTHTYIGP